ncbi:hypothetical protein ACTFJ4_02595 [Serratia nevei]
MKKNKTRGGLQRQANSNRLLAGITPRRCTFTRQTNIFTATRFISAPHLGAAFRPEGNGET